MRLVVDAHKMIKGDVRVALGGGKAGMAEQFLYGAHIRAVLQHVRGEGVAQGVRRQMLRQPGAFADLVENPRRLPPVEPLASVAHEKGSAGGAMSARTLSQRNSALTDVSLNGAMRSLEPLPMTRMKPLAGSTSSTSRSRASEIRSPEP